ncbi:LysR family transcriptional regulator [bacterium]|nr:MAG: LysR family transcriptional regulator [bacterium]
MQYDWLNYNHLYYFWVIANEGGIVAAARKLRLAESTLSAQLRYLEESLGHSLFERQHRRLKMTEPGRLVFDYAETIFSAGREMLDVLRHRPGGKRQIVLRLGVLAGLSKNLQLEFLAPFLGREGLRFAVRQGSLPYLVSELANHRLDFFISDIPVETNKSRDVFNRVLGTIPVCVVGAKKFLGLRRKFPDSLQGAPLYLPTLESSVRADFDRFLGESGVKPEIRAELDDIALLRVFVLHGQGMAVLPEIGVRGELQRKTLFVIGRPPGLRETIYAVTPRRMRPHPLVAEILSHFASRYRDSLKALPEEAS